MGLRKGIDLQTILSTDPRGSPQYLRTATLLGGVPDHAVVTQKSVHKLDGISSDPSYSSNHINKLVPDFGSNINIRHMGQIDQN